MKRFSLKIIIFTISEDDLAMAMLTSPKPVSLVALNVEKFKYSLKFKWKKKSFTVNFNFISSLCIIFIFVSKDIICENYLNKQK